MATENDNFSNFFTKLAGNINSKIEPTVRYHLVKVYTCLTATTLCAAIGAFVHLFGIWEAGLLSALGSLGLVLWLSTTADNSKNFYSRLGMLLGFGLLSGHSLGPLLDHVIAVNPQIIITALVGTSVVFISLSCAALLAERGQFLFLGGLLMSVLSTVTLVSLANLFLQSYAIYQAHLYIGLFVMSAFVLYDTQAIMEKRRAGSTDFVKHSLDLFFDLATVFRRLLIILTQKEERNQRKRRSQ
ncbi:Bax inhibitor 1 [Pseudolycoriella hygida]|uniref:Bax inhibitor 1 n=1 Tax=Pseudolycoriella hygida TaxID=35572 RepID=A0A9Q0N0Q5_9DIPT|nr:Bax inhibitor 1 [Pseudolycoriella hygida]